MFWSGQLSLIIISISLLLTIELDESIFYLQAKQVEVEDDLYCCKSSNFPELTEQLNSDFGEKLAIVQAGTYGPDMVDLSEMVSLKVRATFTI